MLDLSILNADKATNTPKKLQEFLSKTYTITEKFDGTKLTLWRNDQEWNEDYTKNWVVSFKSQILYKEEFDGLDIAEVKEYSVGISQYMIVHNHLEQNHINTKDFPLNTEVFVEFIQNKLTTTRDYHQKHDMFIIGYSSSTAEIVGGMIKTTPQSFETELLHEYSTTLGLATPPIVFEGTIDSFDAIERGMKSWKLMGMWELCKHEYEVNPYDTIKKLFLGFESCLGGKTEGVVLEADDAIYKFVQADQYCRVTRDKRKAQYRPKKQEDNDLYWKEINELSTEMVNALETTDYKGSLLELNTIIQNLDVSATKAYKLMAELI